VLAYLQPTLPNNGETPFKHRIDEFKVKGIIQIKPQQHLWYDIWKYALKDEEGIWSENRFEDYLDKKYRR
jgi:hypothetical protein